MLENFLNNYFAPWAVDAIIDSIKTIPFLFLVFLFIEIFEHFFAGKIKNFLRFSKKSGPILGSIASSIPQCGFSVVASTLYCKKFITKGTIIAVYLATSDEAIPVLLMYPKFLPYILPLILIKLTIAITAGYTIDYFSKNNTGTIEDTITEIDEGCHKHNITNHKKYDFLIHPVKHTCGVFVFILILTLFLNFIIENINISEIFQADLKYITPFITAIFGLIPNCAVSVGLVLMFIKGTINFASLISGLLTGAGIGMLVLLKNNKDKKDTVGILFLLVIIAYFSGLLIQFIN